jgi:uroporphyrinogen-III decarboxylase
LFDYDPPGNHNLGQLGWCEAAFVPSFEKKIIEDRWDYELVQDFAGRQVLYFKGRRDGFMSEYLDHPVKDKKTWEKNVKWRLDPKIIQRYFDLNKRMEQAAAFASQGMMITQTLVGGYMYLRSLIGPENLLFMFCDNPALIHDCMRTWFELAVDVISHHQK